MVRRKTQAPRQWGKERRKLHIDNTISIGTIWAIFIACVSIIVSGVVWYADVEDRLDIQEDKDKELKVEMTKQEDRYNAMLAQYRDDTQRQFGILRSEMTQMRQLLERIAFNTQKDGGEKK